MKYSIEARDGHLHAVVHGRDTGEQMRDFLQAVHAACREHDCPRIVICIRQSRAIFKPEDYGLTGEKQGYLTELVTPACQIALVGDTRELNVANEYIEMVARAQGLNVRAFHDEAAALRWIDGGAAPTRRYRFTRIGIAGAPDDAGVYVLWDGDELVYYGRADGKDANGGSTIRSRLLDHFYADSRPTHYSWELCGDPATREAELLHEHQGRFGRPPRDNKVA